MISRSVSAPLRFLTRAALFCSLIAFDSGQAFAQQQTMPADHQMQNHDMPQMQQGNAAMGMPQMPGMMMQPTNFIEAQLNHLSSGTSAEPASNSLRIRVWACSSFAMLLASP